MFTQVYFRQETRNHILWSNFMQHVSWNEKMQPRILSNVHTKSLRSYVIFWILKVILAVDSACNLPQDSWMLYVKLPTLVWCPSTATCSYIRYIWCKCFVIFLFFSSDKQKRCYIKCTVANAVGQVLVWENRSVLLSKQFRPTQDIDERNHSITNVAAHPLLQSSSVV